MAIQKRPYKSHIQKQAMIAALEKNMGIVTHAARASGVNRENHYAWLQSDPEYARRYRDICEMTIYIVEGEMFKQIKEGNGHLARFYLLTRARHRGYVLRQELTGAEGAPLLPGDQPQFVLEVPYTDAEVVE
jgi:hypothetical protein